MRHRRRSPDELIDPGCSICGLGASGQMWTTYGRRVCPLHSGILLLDHWRAHPNSHSSITLTLTNIRRDWRDRYEPNWRDR